MSSVHGSKSKQPAGTLKHTPRTQLSLVQAFPSSQSLSFEQASSRAGATNTLAMTKAQVMTPRPINPRRFGDMTLTLPAPLHPERLHIAPMAHACMDL
jgi:hypothetical protein